mgnify:CR=1 FL=1|jgi:hypothetical protein
MFYHVDINFIYTAKRVKIQYEMILAILLIPDGLVGMSVYLMKYERRK